MTDQGHTSGLDRPVRSGRGVRPPRQQRSAETMERILDATEELLNGDDFEKIPVTTICATGGVSPSSFYSRFASKDALLRCLHERHLERMRVELIDELAALDWAHHSTRGMVERVIGIYVASRAVDERLQRTFMLASAGDPSYVERDVELVERVLVPVALELLKRHPVDDLDAWKQRFALTAWVVCMAAETGMHGPRRFASRLGLGHDEFVAELSDLALRNLEIPLH